MQVEAFLLLDNVSFITTHHNSVVLGSCDSLVWPSVDELVLETHALLGLLVSLVSHAHAIILTHFLLSFNNNIYSN